MIGFAISMQMAGQINVETNFNLNAKYPLDYRETPILTIADTSSISNNIPYGFRVYCIADGSTWRFNYLGVWEQVMEGASVDLGDFTFSGGLMSGLAQSALSVYVEEMYLNEDQEMNVYIKGTDVEFPDLTNSIINAGGDQYATTKGWVNSKIPSLGNYTFSGDILRANTLNVISVAGTNLKVNESNDFDTYSIFGNSILFEDLTTAIIDASVSDNQAVTKGWVNAKNLQSDWNQTDNTANDYIKNKPSIGTPVYAEMKVDSSIKIISTLTVSNAATLARVTNSTNDMFTLDDYSGAVTYSNDKLYLPAGKYNVYSQANFWTTGKPIIIYKVMAFTSGDVRSDSTLTSPINLQFNGLAQAPWVSAGIVDVPSGGYLAPMAGSSRGGTSDVLKVNNLIIVATKIDD